MEQTQKCPLCGYGFTRSDLEHACKRCPMGGCDLTCCPNCNYQFVNNSKIVNGIRKILKRAKREAR